MSKQLKYFGAEWCTKCQFMKPIVEDICQKNNVELEIIDLSIDETEAKKYDILELPTILNPSNNTMVSGMVTKDKIIDLLK